jgi:hypothetical protein
MLVELAVYLSEALRLGQNQEEMKNNSKMEDYKVPES